MEKTLESHLDSKDMKPVNPKENQLDIHWKDCCGGWNANTLATWRKELTQWKKTLMLPKIEDRRRRGQQKMRWFDGIIDSMDMSLSKLWEIVKEEKPWHGSQRVRHDWVTEQPQQPYKLKQNIVFSPAICFFISVTDSTMHIAASYKK